MGQNKRTITFAIVLAILLVFVILYMRWALHFYNAELAANPNNGPNRVTAFFTTIYSALTLGLFVVALLAAIGAYLQLSSIRKEGELTAYLEIFNQLNTNALRAVRKRIYTEIPVDITGLKNEELERYLEMAEPVISAFNVLGYLIRQGHLDKRPIIDTHWSAIWKCWTKVDPLITWACRRRNEENTTYYRDFRDLFELAEEHRKKNQYKEPKM